MSAFFSALQNGNFKKVKKIINGSDFDPNASILPIGNEYGFYPPLCAVVESGQMELIRLLVERGANVNDAIGCNGMTPLFLAAQEGYEEMCKCFIANGADVNAACSTEACTPLHIAAQFGHTKVVKVLINSHANLNSIKTNDGNTALMVSIHTVRRDIANMLLDAGANVQIRNNCGCSALMIASNRGLEDIVQRLLDAGEDPLREDDKFGCSAIDFAAIANQTVVGEILKRNIIQQKARVSSEEESKTEKSNLKHIAELGINLYETPLQPHETADDEEHLKEAKHKVCDNPACSQPKRGVGTKLMKCNKCRCVRYCGRECQVAHWPIHKKACRKPIL
eukprot:CAMPEP_0172419808 /NCGR_PEP_ID=MMETSP1064-20121228/6211_1 /TAXON_ID=202472 /ORGANISM="Aulacoseira subarctica , Strain CCAP 1002/5" /LENGTH=336 /DNA_ID=CAMNT_0013159463 /DNA_START=58 /DNA_END=1068 /DNA_ORIENTATION=-